MGGLIALSALCLFLLLRDWRRERRIRALAERVEDHLSGNGPMLDVALEEDNLARLQNAISDTQQALERQRELYAQECARTSNLTADISHQLKTPLTTLRLYTELDGAPHAEACLAQIQRMETLIQALLRLERLCADGYAFTFETADAEDILREQWQSIAPMFPGKSLTVSGSAVIRCDEKWLGEAFGNLLKNACEHCDSSIHVSLERTEAAFFCTIEDDGGGVSPAELPRLFDRFYRSENQTGNGVGIGLAIVKEIVSRHHGTITAENGEKGLRMTISMPMLDRNLTKS